MRTPLGRGAIIPAGEHPSGTHPQPAPSTPGQLLPQRAARQVRASVTAKASVELPGDTFVEATDRRTKPSPAYSVTVSGSHDSAMKDGAGSKTNHRRA